MIRVIHIKEARRLMQRQMMSTPATIIMRMRLIRMSMNGKILKFQYFSKKDAGRSASV